MHHSRPLPYHRKLSERDAATLRQGHKPMFMEDKWFFFCEDSEVHLHRSWTGEEVYSLRLSSNADGSADVMDVLVNTSVLDDHDAAIVLDFFLDRILPQITESS